jgi:outer membrane protein
MLGRRLARMLALALALSGGIASAADPEAPAPAAAPAPAIAPTVVPARLSLDDAIALAVRHNPSVEIANQDIHSKLGQVKTAASALQPALNVTTSRIAPVESASVFSSSSPYWETDFTLSQTLYTFGATQKAVRASREVLGASRASYLRAQDRVAFGTRQAYFQVITAQESVRVQKEVLAAAREHRRIAGLRFDAGVAPQYDVLAAEARVARVEQTLSSAIADQTVAWASLSKAIGLPLPDGTELSTPGADAAAVSPLTELVAFALANRADVQSARSQVTAADALIAVARAGSLPSVAATVSYSLLPSTTISTGGEELVVSQSSGSVVFSASWALYDGGVVKGEVETARAYALQAREGVRQLEQQAEFDVRSSYAYVESARAQVTAAQTEVKEAVEANRIANLRYEEGVSTSVEVLDAQTNLGDAQNRLNEAVFALNIALADLDLATGHHLAELLPAGPREAPRG